MKRFVIVQSDKEFYTSHSGLALVGLGLIKFCSLPGKAREAFPLSAESNGIGLDDILRSYLACSRRAKAITKRSPIPDRTTTSGNLSVSGKFLRPKLFANGWTRLHQPFVPFAMPARWSS